MARDTRTLPHLFLLFSAASFSTVTACRQVHVYKVFTHYVIMVQANKSEAASWVRDQLLATGWSYTDGAIIRGAGPCCIADRLHLYCAVSIVETNGLEAASSCVFILWLPVGSVKMALSLDELGLATLHIKQKVCMCTLLSSACRPMGLRQHAAGR